MAGKSELLLICEFQSYSLLLTTMNLIKYILCIFLQLHGNEAATSIIVRILKLFANQSVCGQNNV